SGARAPESRFSWPSSASFCLHRSRGTRRISPLSHGVSGWTGVHNERCSTSMEIASMGQFTELQTSDGARISAYDAAPAASPRGALVVAQEIFGVNSHIRNVCDGYAADGYRVIAPALFDRYERGIDIGYTPSDIARGRELKARATTEVALRDIAAARDAVASSGKVAVIGYCWGGFIAWMSA